MANTVLQPLVFDPLRRLQRGLGGPDEDKPINDAHRTAEATLSAIMGRMATYTGQEITWEQALNSDLDTMPKVLAWDADPGPKAGPDGLYPAPIPGETKAL
jgi:hypothetical protein